MSNAKKFFKPLSYKIENPAMQGNPFSERDLENHILSELGEKTRSGLSIEVEKYLRGNLDKMGFKFQDDEKFYNFLRTRIFRENIYDGNINFYIADRYDFTKTYIGGYNVNVEYNWGNPHSISASINLIFK